MGAKERLSKMRHIREMGQHVTNPKREYLRHAKFVVWRYEECWCLCGGGGITGMKFGARSLL